MTSVREALPLLQLFVAASKCHSGVLYTMLSTHNNLAETSLYLNLGYWETAQTYDEACEALAHVLGEAAQLGSEHEVLDVGFGFADQDIYWVQAFSPKRIVGLNITRAQVEVARRRVASRGLEDRISLHCGSATCMPFPSERFDRVMALEAAFHFSTREEFFREAYRVLRPGGRVATADILPLGADRNSLMDGVAGYVGRSFWQIPRDNLYPRDVYVRKLQSAGFEQIEVRSIRDQVYGPFARYARQRLNTPEIVERLNPIIRMMWRSGARREIGSNTLDYVIVTAEKPHG